MKAFPLLLLSLAACATVPAGDEETYHAAGTEPFWSISIANGRMTYNTPEGGFSVAAPRGQELGDGRLWETRRITLQSSNQECSDGMSEYRYPQTVRAVVDGRTLDGCGGEIMPPASLADTNWSIRAIDGEAVAGDNYMLEFTAGGLAGQAGCNRFSGSYSVSGDRLTAGPLRSTRMACEGPRMAHERKVMAVLGGPVTISYPTGTTLVLTGASGSIRLERAI